MKAAHHELDDDDKYARIANDCMWGDPENALVYDPGDKQRIPKAGAWAMITRRLPAIEGGLDQHIRVGRVFYLEHDASADDNGFLPEGTYKVTCHSPWGDLSLWPYEYSTIDVAEVMRCWQLGELIFHPLHMENARFNEIVHYCRSRGISLANAMVMALGTLAGNVGWFELHPELVEEAEELEEYIHRRRQREGKRKRTIQEPMEVIIQKDGEELWRASTQKKSAVLPKRRRRRRK